MKDTVFNFFKSQKNLKVIRLGVVKAGHREIKQLVFHILESCPKLEEFLLKGESMDLEVSEVSRFVALISKLKCMHLRCLPFFNQSPGPLCSALQLNSINLNLISLRLELTNVHLYTAILRRCTSLQHLHLVRCFDDTLQTIFQYLVSELPEK